MTVSDRTQKILWGRSGNRCVVCRQLMVADASAQDSESVVGEECHICSPRPKGPRHDKSMSAGGFDEQENLILLCRTHHKMVDDQCETYTPQLLKELKRNHEEWVCETLSESPAPPPIRIRRIETPSHLARVTAGRGLMSLIDGACTYQFGHDEPKSPEEAGLIAEFLQSAQDYGDLSAELDAGDRVHAMYEMSQMIESLEVNGFWVFGGRERRQLVGGAAPATSFDEAILQVLRASDLIITAAKLDDGDPKGSVVEVSRSDA